MQRPIFDSRTIDELVTKKDCRARTGLPDSRFPEVILKELIDNALDHAEQHLTDPLRPIVLVLDLHSDGALQVASYDGPGLSFDTLQRVLDPTTFTSTNRKFRAPTRGAQGRGLLDVLSIPVALHNEVQALHPTVVESQGQSYTVDLCRGSSPDISLGSSLVTEGTSTTTYLPPSALDPDTLIGWARAFATFNPHCIFQVYFNGKLHQTFGPGEPSHREKVLKKYHSGMPTNAHSYTSEELGQLIDAFCGLAEVPRLAYFLESFDQIGPHARNKILEALPESRLEDFRFKPEAARRLHSQLLLHSKQKQLTGQVDSEHIRKLWGADEDSFLFQRNFKILGWGIEVAFGYGLDDHVGFVSGLNHSPTYRDPGSDMWVNPHGSGNYDWSSARGIESFVSKLMDHFTDNWGFSVHLVCPNPQFTDPSKSRIKIPFQVEAAIEKMIGTVLKPAINSRKARTAAVNARQRQTTSHIYATFAVIEDAYQHAGGSSGLHTPARMVAYSIVNQVQAQFDIELANMERLTQELIPKYQRCAKLKAQYPSNDWNYEMEQASGVSNKPDWWDLIVPNDNPLPLVVWEARGVFVEPHTGNTVPLGTREVADYTQPPHLFDKVLVCEKIGLKPIFDDAAIAERFDCAIIYPQGQSTTSARDLLAGVVSEGAEVACLYDCDPYGFAQVRALQEPTVRMPDHSLAAVHHIGLRADDAVELGLSSESATIKKGGLPGTITQMLTDTEREWFGYDDDGAEGKRYQRTELNAFTAEGLIDFVEEALTNLGWTKLVPDNETLNSEAEHQQRSIQRQRVIDEILAQYDIDALTDERMTPIEISEEHLRDHLAASPEDSWRDAIADIVTDRLEES